LDNDGTTSNNAFHVVVGGNQSKIDGFIITGGYTAPFQPTPVSSMRGNAKGDTHTSLDILCSGLPNYSGAGLINYQASMLVQNTVFFDNKGTKGGAVYNMNFICESLVSLPAPDFINVGFVKNYADIRGGAVSNDASTNTNFTNCIFEGNAVNGKGGAIYNDFNCAPVISNCQFINNYAEQGGAAVGNDGSSKSTISSSVFTNNTCLDAGCALYQGTYSVLVTPSGATVSDSTITESYAPFGQKSVFNFGEDSVTFTNTVISE